MKLFIEIITAIVIIFVAFFSLFTSVFQSIYCYDNIYVLNEKHYLDQFTNNQNNLTYVRAKYYDYEDATYLVNKDTVIDIELLKNKYMNNLSLYDIERVIYYDENIIYLNLSSKLDSNKMLIVKYDFNLKKHVILLEYQLEQNKINTMNPLIHSEQFLYLKDNLIYITDLKKF